MVSTKRNISLLIRFLSRIFLGSILMLFPLGFRAVTDVQLAYAQSPTNDWTPATLLYQIRSSTFKGDIDSPVIISDRSGQVHVFWKVTKFDEDDIRQEPLWMDIYYSHKKQGEWSTPIDIVAMSRIHTMQATVDNASGTLHLMWSDGSNTSYSSAQITTSETAQGWSPPKPLEIGNLGHIALAQSGRLFVVGPDNSYQPSIQYSDDNGGTWSHPIKIGHSSSSSAGASDFRMVIDNDGILHVVWTEYQMPFNWPPVGVFYSQSEDGGQTWRVPIEIAGLGHDRINVAVAENNTIHVVWYGMAGNAENKAVGGRYHRWSIDGGHTWSPQYQITPHGFTEGYPQLVIDSKDTLHLLTTYDNRVWYGSWQNGTWSPLEYIPTGKEQSIPRDLVITEEIRHIESSTMALAKGNFLHIVFYDRRRNEGNYYLWYTTKRINAPYETRIPFPEQHRIEEDIKTISSRPVATIDNIGETPVPTKTPWASNVNQGEISSFSEVKSPAQPILFGLFPVIIIIGGLIFLRFVNNSLK